jgi:hypothetical protein
MNFMLHNPNEDVFGFPSPPWTLYWKFSQIIKPTPANLFVLIEENPNYIDDAAFAVPLSVNGAGNRTWYDYPSVLHSGECALSFADGHSEMRLWRDPITLNGKPPPPLVPTSYNDAQWLQERTTTLLY